MVSLFILTLVPALAGAQVFTLDEAVDCTVLGAKQFDQIGWDVVSVGDVNDDGLCEFMCVSLNLDTPVEEEFGCLIVGSEDCKEIIDLADITISYVYRVKGVNRVGSVGDFNGDEICDYAVADVIRHVTNVGSAGEVLILYGSKELPSEIDFRNPNLPTVRIQGQHQGEILGNEIRTAGDVNGDGFSDVMFSGFKERTVNALYEVVFIYGETDVPSLLSTDELGNHGFIVESAFELDGLGNSLEAVGDVNGDGFDDVLLGANASGSNEDYAYLIFGATSFPSVLNVGNLGDYGVRIEASGEDFAKAVCAVGDINKDGLADFAIGEPGRDVRGKVNAGGVHIIFGRESFPAQLNADSLGSYGITILGMEAGQTLGQDLSGEADFDGDGFLDLATRPTNQRSEVYIIFGDERFERYGVYNLDALRWVSIQKPTAFPQTAFPEAIEFLGDINGDGYPDLAIGDEFGDAYAGTPEVRYSSGLIHIIYGGKFLQTPTQTETPFSSTSTVTPTVTFTPTPPQSGGFSGWILSGDGKVVNQDSEGESQKSE